MRAANYMTASESAARAADRARIADINIRILELERSLQSLHEEKDLLQDRIDAYTYPVLTLPNEIVSEIFVHVLPEYPRRPQTRGLLAPTTLGQICQKWRDIAFSTPALWRAVQIRLPQFHWGLKSEHSQRTVEKKLRLMNAWLMRSGSCQISIELHCELEEELEPFMQTLAAHGARWEHLKLFLPNLSHLLHSIPASLPCLRTLTMGLWEEMESGPAIEVLTAPLLRKVALQEYHTVYDQLLPWSQLTVLIVDKIALHSCATILNFAINVNYCRLTIGDSDDGFGPSTSPIQPLLRLETLVLRSLYSWEPVDRLFNTLVLPRVGRLQVSETFLMPDPIAALDSFISRSQCNPQKIRILETSLPTERYRAAFPSVEFTHVLQRRIKDLFFVDDDEEVADIHDAEEIDWDDGRAFPWADSGSDECSEVGCEIYDSDYDY
ncbi:hypothetical protein B0H19DRAFT_1098166 [Mycena capillaripes]|nr:hypothetical protein B0H19DRAFT_1098166 [Mycena capillaripes]